MQNRHHPAPSPAPVTQPQRGLPALRAPTLAPCHDCCHPCFDAETSLVRGPGEPNFLSLYGLSFGFYKPKVNTQSILQGPAPAHGWAPRAGTTLP